jgi:hypothetical protein
MNEYTVPTVSDVKGRLVIDWPEPRPPQFPITSEALEGLIDHVDAERALADDLAAVLESLGGLRRPHAEPEVQRVLARWREARQR